MTSAVTIDGGDRPVSIEVAWHGDRRADPAPIVFLHEGLGSVAMWKDFPARVAAACGRTALVYSRPGYGRSTPRAPDDAWAPDFMHRQAAEVLPALLAALEVGDADGRYVLFGHSDGGSIALLHAARFPDRVAAVVALAPHLYVEPVAIASIEKARDAYRSGGLRARLAAYHADPDSAFHGWNDIWLDPGFASWNIDAEVATIQAPVLAIQGTDDEYGTLEQIRRIRRLVPATRLVELPDCRHSPHRDQPDAVIAATRDFLTDLRKPRR